MGAVGARALLVAMAAGSLAACGGSGSAAASGDEKVNAGTGRSDSSGAAGLPVAKGKGTVLFVGTSLTAGLGLEPEESYPSLVAAKIDSAGLPFVVTNAGISGETSSALLRRLDWLLEGAFDVIVVETGANDGLRGIPVATARENIDAVLARVRAARPGARVVLVQMEAPPNLGEAYTTAFRAMYAELAAKHGATLMPFLLEGVAGVGRLNQADGIHPNEAGAKRVASNVWAVLGPLLRSRVDAASPTP